MRQLPNPGFAIVNKLASMEMFVRVVEAGSFRAVAEASGISATMVAKHVDALEKQLGVRLLHRTTRRHHLSEVGKLYYERCRSVLAEVELADASVSELQVTPQGRLRMLAPVSFGTHCLVPALARLMDRHPDVAVDLTLDNRAVNPVGEGYELGIHVGRVEDPSLVARPLRPYRRCLAAAPAYLERHGHPEHPRQLGEHACLGLSYWRKFDRWKLIGPDGEVCLVDVQGRFTANQGEALRLAAIHGQGIVLQPEPVLAGDLASGQLQAVLPDWSFVTTPLYLVYAQDRRPTAKLRVAVEFLLECFG